MCLPRLDEAHDGAVGTLTPRPAPPPPTPAVQTLHYLGGCTLRPPAVALAAFSPHAAPSAAATAAATVIDSMRAFGYAVISVDPDAVQTIHASYAAVLRFYRYACLEAAVATGIQARQPPPPPGAPPGTLQARLDEPSPPPHAPLIHTPPSFIGGPSPCPCSCSCPCQCSKVPREEKQKFMRFFDGQRYLGWAQDPAREWLQLRVCEGGRGGGEGGNGGGAVGGLPMAWPAACPAQDASAMMAAVALLTTSAEAIFEEVRPLARLDMLSLAV